MEINSSFYRPHQFKTYQRWADSVPEGFGFAVKVPKAITHQLRLRDSEAALDEFLGQCAGLGDKLGCLLIQLPPSFAFELAVANVFFTHLRQRFTGSVAVEPRHESWHGAQALLIEHRIARVAADPSPISEGTVPGGWDGLLYYRLHGSPRIYHSAYTPEFLEALAQALHQARVRGAEAWCIFDNTASGAATSNVLALQALLR